MLRLIIALLASGVTGIQVYLLYGGNSGICFNDGCAVVDSLTAVPPLYFNLAGFLFFQLVFWLSCAGMRDKESLPQKFIRLLLLAALAMEAVLVFFQYRIAQVFCSYCLVIFAIILLLNIFSGIKQTFRGLVLFCAVFIACSSLSFKPKTLSLDNLQQGTMAIAGNKKKPDHFLFFSKDCSHCEKIITILRQENLCTVGFNPIIPPAKLDLPHFTMQGQYDPLFNRDLLNQFGFQQVPLLIVSSGQELRFVEGETGITRYLREHCQTVAKATVVPRVEPLDLAPVDGQSKANQGADSFWETGKSGKNDGCSTSTDCGDAKKSSSETVEGN